MMNATQHSNNNNNNNNNMHRPSGAHVRIDTASLKDGEHCAALQLTRSSVPSLSALPCPISTKLIRNGAVAVVKAGNNAPPKKKKKKLLRKLNLVKFIRKRLLGRAVEQSDGAIITEVDRRVAILVWEQKMAAYALGKRNAERLEQRNFYNDHPELFDRVEGKFRNIGPLCDEVEEDGKQIGELFFGKLLGEGGFGQVFAATSNYSREAVAVKVLEKTKLSLLESAETEVGILRRHSHHPNIISLRAVVHAPSNIYVVMERATMDLQTLRNDTDLIRTQKDGIEQITIGILEALEYLHGRGIAHLDLKSGNVLVCSSSWGRPGARIEASDIRLADFGVSAMSSNYFDPRNTGLHNDDPASAPLDLAVNLTPCTRGTDSHMAPELLDGCDGRMADMWSLGCILARMVFTSARLRQWKDTCNCLASRDRLPEFRRRIAGSLEGLKEGVKATWTPYQNLSRGKKLFGFLFEDLLVLDVAKRAPSARALRHPWLQSC